MSAYFGHPKVPRLERSGVLFMITSQARDTICSGLSCSVTNVHHGHEGVSPKLVKEFGEYQLRLRSLLRIEFSTVVRSV
jgi:hypothetical protein